MANYITLNKGDGWNYYVFQGHQCTNIHYYDPETAKVLCSEGRGWTCISGSNNDGNSALEALEFRTRRKPFLNTPEPFHIGGELFVPITSLPECKFLGEEVVIKFDDGQENYGLMIQYKTGATTRYAQNYPHLTEVKVRKFHAGCYTRTEYTGEAGHKRALEHFFKVKEIEIRSYEVRKLRNLSAEDKKELIKLIGN